MVITMVIVRGNRTGSGFRKTRCGGVKTERRGQEEGGVGAKKVYEAGVQSTTRESEEGNGNETESEIALELRIRIANSISQ